MATVNYYLDKAFSDDRISEIKDKSLAREILSTKRQIYLNLSSSGKRIKIYTKKRIEQRFWDQNKQRVDANKYKPNGTEFNKWLTDLQEDVEAVAERNELLSKLTTKAELEEVLSRHIIEVIKEENFEDQFTEFLTQHKTGDGNSIRENTKKKYNGLKKHLVNFSESEKIKLDVRIFDKGFVLNFKDYLTEEIEVNGEIVKKKQNDNTVSKYIKAIKPLIRYYINKGLIKPYPLNEIKSIERDGEIYVLPINQVIELQKKELTKQSLIHARDFFCFMCWTGQRYEEYRKLRHEDFSENDKGEKEWKLITTKTNTSVTVPIFEYAQDILDKYSESPFPLPQLSNQKLNEYLKDLGEVAELNFQVKIVKYFDGKKVEENVPFYKVLTTHVARKSFITNALILDVPERVVKEISGHKDEKSFRRYVQLAESYKSRHLQKAFNKDNISKYLKDENNLKS